MGQTILAYSSSRTIKILGNEVDLHRNRTLERILGSNVPLSNEERAIQVEQSRYYASSHILSLTGELQDAQKRSRCIWPIWRAIGNTSHQLTLAYESSF